MGFKIYSLNLNKNIHFYMELTTGQIYWYINHLLKTGMIRKLRATEYVGNKGKQQSMYKFSSSKTL